MKIWTIDEIRNLIDTNDTAVARGIVAIWKFQTPTEQGMKETAEHNGVGFNGVDAHILSSFAEFYQERGFLSAKQTALGRKKIRKYAGQLTAIANSEA